MKIILSMLGILGLLLVFGYVVNDGNWAWLEYQTIMGKSFALIIIIAVYWVYLLLVFGVVTPTKKQVLVRGSLYILFIVGVAVGLFLIRSYLPNAIVADFVSSLIVGLGYMLLYSIYIVINYGFINNNTHQPIIVRVGNLTLDIEFGTGYSFPLPWVLFVVISNNLRLAELSMLNIMIMLLAILSIVALCFLMLAPFFKHHQKAAEEYYEQHPEDKPLTVEQHEELAEQQRVERLTRPSKVNENIAKFKAEQRLKEQQKQALPWWMFWR